MAPHAMETILPTPQWPVGLSNFVTWCLMWDPKNRPTSKQAMEHEFFTDAVDPLRPKSSSKLLGRKHSDLSFRSKEGGDGPTISSKPSWFRRSLIARESAPAVPQHDPNAKAVQSTEPQQPAQKLRPQASKRATWTNGTTPAAAPMPILPSIKPISPLPNAVTAQANSTFVAQPEAKVEYTTKQSDDKAKKLGRQLSVNSNGNHYADAHRQEAERALNGNSGLASPPNGQKESFFSHLRKRARRFSGRHGLASPGVDDVEANVTTVPWSNRSSVIVDNIIPEGHADFLDLDTALQNVRYSLEKPQMDARVQARRSVEASPNSGNLKRSHSIGRSRSGRSVENLVSSNTPVGSRARRNLHMSGLPASHYDTPAEEDELLDEALQSANRAARRLNVQSTKHDVTQTVIQQDPHRYSVHHVTSNPTMQHAYLTPSPSAKRNGVQFGYSAITPSQPLNIANKRSDHDHTSPHWPTPPYEESDWANAASANLFTATAGGR